MISWYLGLVVTEGMTLVTKVKSNNACHDTIDKSVFSFRGIHSILIRNVLFGMGDTSEFPSLYSIPHSRALICLTRGQGAKCKLRLEFSLFVLAAHENFTIL